MNLAFKNGKIWAFGDETWHLRWREEQKDLALMGIGRTQFGYSGLHEADPWLMSLGRQVVAMAKAFVLCSIGTTVDIWWGFAYSWASERFTAVLGKLFGSREAWAKQD